jgi:nucleotide-binding universal stress UspA family protein
MYKRILLPLDLTDRHGAALRRAAEVAAHSDAQIRLLHVVATIAGLDFDSQQDFYGRLYDTSQSKLAAAAAQLAAQGHHVEFATVYGNRGDEILKYAVEQDIDLMIVRAQALNTEAPQSGLASLSWKLGLLTNCDVLLVK